MLPPALLPLEVLAVLRVLVPAREAAWATTAVSGEARRDTSAYCLPGKKKDRVHCRWQRRYARRGVATLGRRLHSASEAHRGGCRRTHTRTHMSRGISGGSQWQSTWRRTVANAPHVYLVQPPPPPSHTHAFSSWWCPPGRTSSPPGSRVAPRSRRSPQGHPHRTEGLQPKQ